MLRLATLCVIATAWATATPALGAVRAPSDTPQAAFSTSPSNPVTGQPVTFDGSASNDPDGDTITTYRWEFGDGTQQNSTTASVQHTYTKAGSFTASLIVVDSKGNDSASVSHTVSVITAETGPVARFKVTKGLVVGQTGVFDASKSHDNDGDAITSYRWSFGDGASQTTASAVTTHAYVGKGKFVATLAVVDSRGNVSALQTHVVSVHNPPVYKVPGNPKAHFKFSPRHPVTGQSVFFDGSKSTGGGGSIKAYMWTFGDGSGATGTSPTINHAYGLPGTYLVQLVVENTAGRFSAPATRRLTVTEGPRLTRLHVRACVHRSHRCPVRGLRIRFRLNVGDQVTLTLTRRRHHHVILQQTVFGHRGENFVTLAFDGHRRAHYVLRATPAGGKTRRAQFVWRRR